MNQKNIALVLAYDGSTFFGWQKTSTGPSIEQTLEEVLQQILQQPILLQAASRTDRGVHAEGQCVNFLTRKMESLENLLKGLNALLPPSIRVLGAYQMPLDFHPTLFAEKKEYHYRISMGSLQLPQERFFSWHVPYPLHLQNMRDASLHFLGRHDFSSFCNNCKNLNYTDTMRHMESLEILEIGHNHLQFIIKGSHFLYKMVRNIVGTLIYVGRGKISFREIPELFSLHSRAKAGITAPAHGLTLKKIYYPQQFMTLFGI